MGGVLGGCAQTDELVDANGAGETAVMAMVVAIEGVGRETPTSEADVIGVTGVAVNESARDGAGDGGIAVEVGVVVVVVVVVVVDELGVVGAAAGVANGSANNCARLSVTTSSLGKQPILCRIWASSCIWNDLLNVKRYCDLSSATSQSITASVLVLTRMNGN
jgi:hypothetical protein